MMTFKYTYYFFMLLFICLVENSAIAQKDVVLHHRNNAVEYIKSESFDDIRLAKTIFTPKYQDTIRANVLRIWERELLLLFKLDFKRLITEIHGNDKSYFFDENKRLTINRRLSRYFPYYYVEQYLFRDELKKEIFNYLIEKQDKLYSEIKNSTALNAEEKSFLSIYLFLYVYYAQDECSEDVQMYIINKSKEHMAQFPVSKYNDFLHQFILDYTFPSNFTLESSIVPFGVYRPNSGELKDVVKSKFNILHLSLGFNYKNTFLKASGGFSYLRFNAPYQFENNKGHLGANGQVIFGQDFHVGRILEFTISPYVGLNSMMFSENYLNMVFKNSIQTVVFRDVSPIFGVSIDLNTSIVNKCYGGTVSNRSFHRVQFGISPMSRNNSGTNEKGTAIMFQYSIGFQRSIKKMGYQFD